MGTFSARLLARHKPISPVRALEVNSISWCEEVPGSSWPFSEERDRGVSTLFGSCCPVCSFFHTLKHHPYTHLALLSEHCICMDPSLMPYRNSYHWFNFSENCTIPVVIFLPALLWSHPWCPALSQINFSLKLDSHFAPWKIVIHSHTCIDIQTHLICILF